MSTHDRGAFGALLAEAKALGIRRLAFDVDLTDDDGDERWTAGRREDPVVFDDHAHGRTGEEAFRRLIESLRAEA